jgi:acetyltransferase-like isoleucine patch superfamily enzyme
MSPAPLPHDWYPESLPANCRLGAGSWLYSSFALRHYRAVAASALEVGEHTGLYNGTFFDLGPDARVRIGDYCSIVGAIFSTHGQVTIGDYVFISHEVVIADVDDARPPDAELAADVRRRGVRIVIDDDVWIGAQAIVVGSVHIGAGAIIGAAALVDQDVPPYAIYAGNPGRVVGYASRGSEPRPESLPG